MRSLQAYDDPVVEHLESSFGCFFSGGTSSPPSPAESRPISTVPAPEELARECNETREDDDEEEDEDEEEGA